MKRIVLVVLLVIALGIAFLALTTPSSSGGSATYIGPVHTQSLVLVSQKAWKRKGAIRHVGHHARLVTTKTRIASGPCYRIEAEVHGDSWAIDKVVQGLGHFKLCMKPGDHTQVLDKYTNASSSHRETWMWDFQSVDEVKGAGVSTRWCNGGVGPCQPVEYRYWRYTFHWLQGVNVFGQTVGLHHKTLFIGCTLRAGPGGYQCGMGEA